MTRIEKEGLCYHPKGKECPFHFDGECKVGPVYPIDYQHVKRENPCVFTIMKRNKERNEKEKLKKKKQGLLKWIQ